MPVIDRLFAEIKPLLGSVPIEGQRCVCDHCLGPTKPPFAFCYACDQLLDQAGDLRERLQSRVVPMSTALKPPGDWYGYLFGYKGAETGKAAALSSFVSTYVLFHKSKLRRLLGGDWLTTIVPSKRGVPFTAQPLRAVAERAESLDGKVQRTLVFRSGASLGRQQCDPAVFSGLGVSVRRRPVLLLEDTWVSGSTAMSAAAALLRLGAASVLVLAIARLIDCEFWGPTDHGAEYLRQARAPFQIGRWPRPISTPPVGGGDEPLLG